MDKAPDAFRTISEVADDLDLPQHVLRFWETRFAQIKPMKRGGGRRYYRPEDIDLLRGIRHLLYGEGYTIRGVQRILKDEGVKFVQSVWRSGAPQPVRSPSEAEAGEEASSASIDNGIAEEEAGRGRGFFGILPSLLGAELAGDAGQLPAASQAHRASPAAPENLSHEQLRALRATLDDLGECKRLLDGAVGEE